MGTTPIGVIGKLTGSNVSTPAVVIDLTLNPPQMGIRNTYVSGSDLLKWSNVSPLSAQSSAQDNGLPSTIQESGTLPNSDATNPNVQQGGTPTGRVSGLSTIFKSNPLLILIFLAVIILILRKG